MSPRHRYGLLVAAILLGGAVSLGGCASDESSTCDPDRLDEDGALRQRVRQEGQLAVMVMLDLEVPLWSELDAEEEEAYRQRIVEMQQQLLAELEGTDA